MMNTEHGLRLAVPGIPLFDHDHFQRIKDAFLLCSVVITLQSYSFLYNGVE